MESVLLCSDQSSIKKSSSWIYAEGAVSTQRSCFRQLVWCPPSHKIVLNGQACVLLSRVSECGFLCFIGAFVVADCSSNYEEGGETESFNFFYRNQGAGRYSNRLSSERLQAFRTCQPMSCATECDHIRIFTSKMHNSLESRELGTGLTAVLTKVVTTDNQQIMYHYPITYRRLTDSVSLTEMATQMDR